MSSRTKSLAIPAEVKKRVYERDNGMCVWCGKPGDPVAHYISRAQGGKGVEQNILTLCSECHRRYDQTPDRKEMRRMFREYLSSKYPDWNENEYLYRKGE